jgi:hypothetical protein
MKRALLALLVLAAACQNSAPAPDGAIQISPPAVHASPGQQVQFSVTSPPGLTAADFVWSLDPATEGTIDANGLFTASAHARPTAGTCTVIATLRSDPSRVGMAVVMIDQPPPPASLPTTMVAASGGQQSAGAVQLESIALEPVSATTSTNAAGTIEVRSGFFPSGSLSSP